jgi:hypothetical protein
MLIVLANLTSYYKKLVYSVMSVNDCVSVFVSVLLTISVAISLQSFIKGHTNVLKL